MFELAIVTGVGIASFGMFLLGRWCERLYAREIMKYRTRSIQRAVKPVNLFSLKGDDSNV